MSEITANTEQPCTLDCPAQELLSQKKDYLGRVLQELQSTRRDVLSREFRIQLKQNDPDLSETDIVAIIDGFLVGIDGKIKDTELLITHCTDESHNLASECDYPVAETATRKNAQFLVRLCTAPIVYENTDARLDIPVHVERRVVPE